MSQENAQRIQELEFLRKQDQETVLLADKWEKLKKYPLFKELVLENYLEKTAIQMVHNYSNPSSGISSEDMANTMTGISELKQYIDSIPMRKQAAIERTWSVEQELEHLRGEE